MLPQASLEKPLNLQKSSLDLKRIATFLILGLRSHFCLKWCPVKDRYQSVGDLDLNVGYRMTYPESRKPIFSSEQWHRNGRKKYYLLLAQVSDFSHHRSHTKILPFLMKCSWLQWSPNLGLNGCENTKKSKHRNVLALRVWWKVILNWNEKIFFLLYL